MFKFDFINDNEKTEDIENVKEECSPQCRPSLEVSLSAGTHVREFMISKQLHQN